MSQDQRQFNKRVQSLLNYLGADPKLLVDGAVGPKTEVAISRALAKYINVDVPTSPGSTKPFWVAGMEKKIGWTEFDHDAEIAQHWPIVGLNYKTVIGTSHAWCGLACAIELHEGGVQIPKHAAGAANWEKDKDWSEPCAYICGAFLPLRHAKGGRHITIFLYWHDEKNKIAACLGGNQNNAYRISLYNLSGNANGHEEVVGGPVWPKDYPQTGYVYPQANIVAGGSETTR